MKNQIELQQEILKVQSQIREIQQNLKNSKSYLKYLKECFEVTISRNKRLHPKDQKIRGTKSFLERKFIEHNENFTKLKLNIFSERILS
jgi:hypothetical protein